MRFSILDFIILLIGCSSNSRSIKVEDMCVFDTVSENHIIFTLKKILLRDFLF